MTEKNDFINELFNKYTGVDKNNGYHCNKCGYELTRVNNGNNFEAQKMFFCTNKKCERFGLVTVVAIKKPKSH